MCLFYDLEPLGSVSKQASGQSKLSHEAYWHQMLSIMNVIVQNQRKKLNVLLIVKEFGWN